MFKRVIIIIQRGPSWPRSCGSWIYNSLSNQCLSPLTFLELNPANSEAYSIQHYVIKFLNDLRLTLAEGGVKHNAYIHAFHYTTLFIFILLSSLVLSFKTLLLWFRLNRTIFLFWLVMYVFISFSLQDSILANVHLKSTLHRAYRNGLTVLLM